MIASCDSRTTIVRLARVLVDTHGDCHLHDDDVAEMHGFPPAEDRACRLAIFCDAYGLGSHYRAHRVTRMIEVAVQGSAAEAASVGITPRTIGHIPRAWAVTWQVRSAAWMARHRRLLEVVGCTYPSAMEAGSWRAMLLA